MEGPCSERGHLRRRRDFPAAPSVRLSTSLRLRPVLSLSRRRVASSEVAAEGGDVCGELWVSRIGEDGLVILSACIASAETSAHRASAVDFMGSLCVHRVHLLEHGRGLDHGNDGTDRCRETVRPPCTFLPSRDAASEIRNSPFISPFELGLRHYDTTLGREKSGCAALSGRAGRCPRHRTR